MNTDPTSTSQTMHLPANLTFILGGARSGKSSYSEQRAREYGDNVIYCATAEILDREMADRVQRHQQRRPQTWLTVEAPHHAAEKLDRQDPKFQTLRHVELAAHSISGADTMQKFDVLADCLKRTTNNLAMIPHWDELTAEIVENF